MESRLDEIIIEECMERGWSLRQLAERAGMSYQRLLQILVGSRTKESEAYVFGTVFSVSPRLFLSLQRNVPYYDRRTMG